ncbi:MAG: SMI1/KNR4 family protein, partial [Planctomycetota bacterium]
MKHRWQTIETWLAENAPPVLRTLNPPATPDEIVSLEQALGVRLPPSVRATYAIHDGESSTSDGLFGLWRLLPLGQARKVSGDLFRLSRDYGFDDF